MSEQTVRIIRLEPMRVASIWGFGPGPEEIAWQKLNGWARPKGLLDDPAAHPIYGFNNPNPAAGSPNYGYELWIQVEADFEPDAGDEVRVLDFAGGLYAVARCEVPAGGAYEAIPATWKNLVTWLEDSEYQHAGHQWLEKSVNEAIEGVAFVLDLYLPVAE